MWIESHKHKESPITPPLRTALSLDAISQPLAPMLRPVHQLPSPVHQLPSPVHQLPSPVHQLPSPVHQSSPVHQLPSTAHQLMPLVLRNPMDKRLNLHLAQAQMREGNLDSAVGTLHRILFFAPDDATALLDLAFLEITRQKYHAARTHLQHLQGRRDLSLAMQARIDALLAETRSKLDIWQVSGHAHLELGLRGNALQAASTDDGFVTDILLYTQDSGGLVTTPFIVHNEQAHIDSAYIVSQIAVRLKTARRKGEHIEIDFIARHNAQFAREFPTEISGHVQINYTRAHKGGHYLLGVRFNRHKLKSFPSYTTWSVFLRGDWQLTTKTAFTSALSYHDTTPPNASGREHQLNLRLGGRTALGRGVLTTHFEAIDYRSSRGSHDSYAYRIQLGYGHRLGARAYGAVNINFAARQYRRGYILNPAHRQRDKTQSIALTLTQNLAHERIRVRHPAVHYHVSYQNTDSNIPLESYQSWRGAVSLSWKF